MNIFQVVFYQPLLNVLILFYQYLPVRDFGLAIICLTILIKLLLYPLTSQSLKSQKSFESFQVKLREIQEKYKDNKEEQAKATMELYRKEKINPFSGCLPLLIQIPVIFALFQVTQKGLAAEEMVNLYSFVPQPGEISPYFLGILNLTQPNLILAFLAAILQFIQSKMTTSSSPRRGGKRISLDQFSQMMQTQMIYLLPIITFLFLLRLPAAVGLYWLMLTLFTIIQQYLIFKPQTKVLQGGAID